MAIVPTALYAGPKKRYCPAMKIRFSWKKLTLWLVGIFLMCGLVGGGAVALLFYWASRDLPTITRIADYNPPQATTVLARDGSVLGLFYHEKRFVIGLKDMSRFLPLSFLAAEDDSFYRTWAWTLWPSCARR